MRFRVSALLLVTTGIATGVVVTNDLAGFLTTTSSNSADAVASAPLLSAVSPAEASETAVQPQAGTGEASVVAKAPAVQPANMVCRDAAWPYVERRCETTAEREDQKVRHVRIISLDRGSPRNVSAPVTAIEKAERVDGDAPLVAMGQTATGARSEASGTAALITAQNNEAASSATVTTLPPARPDLSATPEAEVALAAEPTAAAANEAPTVSKSIQASAPEARTAAAPVTHATPAPRHKVRTARRPHESVHRLARGDEDGIDPGYDARSAVRTTVTYGYREPDGRQYYYRYGPGGQRQDLAYGDYPAASRGYAYAPRRPLNGSLFGWLSDD